MIKYGLCDKAFLKPDDICCEGGKIKMNNLHTKLP